MADEENVDRGDEFEPTGADAKNQELSTKDKEPSTKDEATGVKDDDKLVDKDKIDEEDDNTGESETDSLSDDEETEEERAEREAAEAEEAKKKRIRIPKARFDEAMQKAKDREAALQRQIADLEKQQSGKAEKTELDKLQKDVDDLQDKYEDLLLEGKKDEARAVRKEMNSKREELYDRRTTTKSEAAKRAAVEELKYDSALARHEASHPAINPDSDQFDEDTVTEVGELLQAFVARGFTRYAALDKAVKYVLGAPKEESKGSKSTEEADAIRTQRAAEARRKAADAEKRQPADTTLAGKDSDKGGDGADGTNINVLKLSQEKFAELTEEQLSKLRGDTV